MPVCHNLMQHNTCMHAWKTTVTKMVECHCKITNVTTLAIFLSNIVEIEPTRMFWNSVQLRPVLAHAHAKEKDVLRIVLHVISYVCSYVV